MNPQLSEEVRVLVTVDADAEPGRRELRLNTPIGLSSPLGFYVGKMPEYYEVEPNDQVASEAIEDPIPFVLNGQVMPPGSGFGIQPPKMPFDPHPRPEGRGYG